MLFLTANADNIVSTILEILRLGAPCYFKAVC